MFILIINPGSTSTKIAIFENETSIFQKTLRHSVEELSHYHKIAEQFTFRKKAILDALTNEAKFDVSQLSCIVGRGGLLKPIAAGIYEVNKLMLDDLSNGKYGEHASNLGALIAHEIASSLTGVKAYIADPVVVDELEDVARISGNALVERVSIFHALNQRAVARRYAKENNTAYEKLNLIVAHLGGGTSVGAHKHGRIVDVNDALNGEGPFSPERSGGLTAWSLAKICLSGKYTEREVREMIVGKGGYVSYLGTNDALEVENRALQGDEKAALIEQALAYQVAKEIGAMAAVLNGKVDAINITGGLAYDKAVVNTIENKTKFIAPVTIYAGEDELKALAENAILLSQGEQQIKIYQ